MWFNDMQRAGSQSIGGMSAEKTSDLSTAVGMGSIGGALGGPWGAAGMFILGGLLSAVGASEKRRRARRQQKKFMAFQRQQKLQRQAHRASVRGRLLSGMGSAAKSYFG